MSDNNIQIIEIGESGVMMDQNGRLFTAVPASHFSRSQMDAVISDLTGRLVQATISPSERKVMDELSRARSNQLRFPPPQRRR